MALQRTIGNQIYLSNHGGLKCVESCPIIEDSFEQDNNVRSGGYTLELIYI